MLFTLTLRRLMLVTLALGLVNVGYFDTGG
jgi:hypothetical protein